MLSKNIQRQAMTVDRQTRAMSLGQQASVLWFTGLSGAGKSTVADLAEAELHQRGYHTYLLDGDNVRHGLCGDLDFSDTGRSENIRRAGEVAKLMVEAGLIVLATFISPFRAQRAVVRSMFGPGEFFEIYVDTPLAVAERRDPKGLYKRARRGELRNFTGIDSAYEPPDSPEIRLDTLNATPQQSARAVIDALERAGRLSSLRSPEASRRSAPAEPT
jgi:bifunctional enzyme CysN/CysC